MESWLNKVGESHQQTSQSSVKVFLIYGWTLNFAKAPNFEEFLCALLHVC